MPGTCASLAYRSLGIVCGNQLLGPAFQSQDHPRDRCLARPRSPSLARHWLRHLDARSGISVATGGLRAGGGFPEAERGEDVAAWLDRDFEALRNRSRAFAPRQVNRRGILEG
jgi:hypothetical protein